MISMNEQERNDVSKLFSKIQSTELKSVFPKVVNTLRLSEDLVLYFIELRKRVTEKEFENELAVIFASMLSIVCSDIDESLVVSDLIRKALEKLDQNIRKI